MNMIKMTITVRSTICRLITVIAAFIFPGRFPEAFFVHLDKIGIIVKARRA